MNNVKINMNFLIQVLKLNIKPPGYLILQLLALVSSVVRQKRFCTLFSKTSHIRKLTASG